MRKHFWRLAILFLAIGGGYFLLNRESVSSYPIPFIEVTKKDFAKSVGQVSENLLDYGNSLATSTTASLAGQAAEKTVKIFSNIIDGAKTEVFKVIKGTVNKKVDSIGVDLGVDVGRLNNEPAAKEIQSPVIFTIKTGAPAYFTIKNKENGVLQYEVDWQDGKSESGKLAAGQSKLLSHAWLAVGQYEINFKVSDQERAKEYAIAIATF